MCTKLIVPDVSPATLGKPPATWQREFSTLGRLATWGTLKSCNQKMKDAEIEVIDRSNNPIKLLPLETLHISSRAPSKN